MEKVVAGTGTSVAHALETEVFNFDIEDLMEVVAENGQPAPTSKSVYRKKHFAVSISELQNFCVLFLS